MAGAIGDEAPVERFYHQHEVGTLFDRCRGMFAAVLVCSTTASYKRPPCSAGRCSSARSRSRRSLPLTRSAASVSL
jgi:hypothetical protein